MSSVNSVDSLGTLQWDMVELAGHLRQERLFVNSEQQNLQTLNEKVRQTFFLSRIVRFNNNVYNANTEHKYACI